MNDGSSGFLLHLRSTESFESFFFQTGTQIYYFLRDDVNCATAFTSTKNLKGILVTNIQKERNFYLTAFDYNIKIKISASSLKLCAAQERN